MLSLTLLPSCSWSRPGYLAANWSHFCDVKDTSLVVVASYWTTIYRIQLMDSCITSEKTWKNHRWSLIFKPFWGRPSLTRIDPILFEVGQFSFKKHRPKRKWLKIMPWFLMVWRNLLAKELRGIIFNLLSAKHFWMFHGLFTRTVADVSLERLKNSVNFWWPPKKIHQFSIP